MFVARLPPTQTTDSFSITLKSQDTSVCRKYLPKTSYDLKINHETRSDQKYVTGSDAKYIDGSQEWFAAVKGFLRPNIGGISRVKCSQSDYNKITMIVLLAFAHDLFGINGHGTVSL